MAETQVISALKEKRAELAGELHQAELRVTRLRSELLAIDGALRVFDPKISPHAIRPIKRRNKPTRFRHGDFTRLIKDVLRRSTRPMSCRAIAEQIALECDMNRVPQATWRPSVVPVASARPVSLPTPLRREPAA